MLGERGEDFLAHAEIGVTVVQAFLRIAQLGDQRAYPLRCDYRPRNAV